MNQAFLDFETTGFTQLDLKKVYEHKILEFGLAVTDEHYNLIATQSIVIGQKFADYEHLIDDVVREMHTSNGLFKECEESLVTLADAQQQAIAFYMEHGINPKQSSMGGNGVTFDRMFAEAQTPLLNDFLRYRQLDISVIKEFLKPIFPSLEPAKQRPHRAVPDLLESVGEAKIYYDFLRHLAANAPLINLRTDLDYEPAKKQMLDGK
jgi:oligoribonuclease